MKKLFLIPLVIVLVSGLILGGCAKPAPAPAPPTPEGDVVGAVEAELKRRRRRTRTILAGAGQRVGGAVKTLLGQ